MTTINASVFAGLTGANPALITRAVALINDQRLTSLESLRQELNHGTWTIRVATPADKLTDPAVYIDPVRDPVTKAIIERGQILLRPENLTRSDDAAVLKLIDNLRHEGAHGDIAKEATRSAARNELVGAQPDISVTERGDQYINTILDDESNARYASWLFRTQLDGLGTEYAASNRASLATDELYKEFTRLEGVANGLGLTGTNKSTYVVEHARHAMAAYDDHSYATTSAKFVTRALGINGTQAGTDYLNHVQKSYNATGYEVTDPVMHNDGSSSASVIYQDGRRTEVIFDSDGNLFRRTEGAANGDRTSTDYFANGKINRITEIDGAHDNADYASRTTAYDAQGRLEQVSVTRDDGSLHGTAYDVRNSYSESRWEMEIDAQGRTDWAMSVGDNGTYYVSNYDQLGNQSWKQIDTAYDIWDRADYSIKIMDDGSYVTTDYDQSGVRSDSVWQNYFDSQGRVEHVNITYDNGSLHATTYDVPNAYSASRWEMMIDAQGRTDWAKSVEDNGVSYVSNYDQDGTHSWNQILSHFDAWGREAWRNVTYDDGSRLEVDLDETGENTWVSIQSLYDPQGRLLDVTYLSDNGSSGYLGREPVGGGSMSGSSLQRLLYGDLPVPDGLWDGIIEVRVPEC
ncbi:hypothetical protein AB4Z46_04490 [Variovorax sp. M-6]|uniref:hypothetical protein n=1 Tax=Variovorax sp. M-6 TaxID=3233041 RepID=UPI003F9A15C1